MIRPLLAGAILIALASVRPIPTLAQSMSRTRILMLGTGTPIPDPDRKGPALVIIVDSTAYLFDAGVGVVRQASAAGRLGVVPFAPPRPGVQPNPQFDRIFLTHLHSDHTLGLADAIFTPWIQGRTSPVDIHGPPGTAWLVSTILDGNAEDIQERVAAPAGPSRDGWRARVHEMEPGQVFRDERVTVRAFLVPHSGWRYAYGYRIDTPDRSIVISGDTRESDAVVDACNGCDVLIHEVISDSAFHAYAPERQAYHAAAHTLATGVGRVASRARAGMLILTHILSGGLPDDVILREVRTTFSGRVFLAHDLDVY